MQQFLLLFLLITVHKFTKMPHQLPPALAPQRPTAPPPGPTPATPPWQTERGLQVGVPRRARSRRTRWWPRLGGRRWRGEAVTRVADSEHGGGPGRHPSAARHHVDVPRPGLPPASASGSLWRGEAEEDQLELGRTRKTRAARSRSAWAASEGGARRR